MCSIDAYERAHQSSRCDDGSSSGECKLPTISTTSVLYSIGANMDLIGCWIKSLERNFLERCHLYTRFMKELFNQILVELPNKPSPKEKCKSLLHAIVGG